MLDDLFKNYKNLVFFDTETTGLDPKKDRIIELACTQVKADGTCNQFDYFVEPDDHRPIPQEITDLTSISHYDVYEGDNHISEEAAIAWFKNFIDEPKTLLIAHNAQFDLNFVAELLIRHDAKDIYPVFKAADYLDTVTVYKDRAKYPHRLCSAIEHYNLGAIVQNSHRAIDDTDALLHITEAMCKERADVHEYVNIFGYNKKYGVSGTKFKKVTYLAQPYFDYMKPADSILPRAVHRAKVQQIKLEEVDKDE